MPNPQSPAAPPSYGDFVDTLQRSGAASQDSALPRAALPTISAAQLGIFLEADIIREPTPGMYYLTTPEERTSMPSRPSRPYTPMRVAMMLAVWSAVIAVPLIVWLFAR